MAEEQTAQPTEAQTTETSTQETQSAEESTLLGTQSESKESETSKESTEESGEAKEGESKEGEEQSSEVPETYEAKVPEGLEGVEIDQPLVDKLTPVLKDLKITQEGFQKLVNVFAPHVKEQAEAVRQASLKSFNDMVGEWKAETQKALGADANAQLGKAATFIDKMAESQEHADQVRELLNETGVGNHIALVKLLVKAGNVISEDSFASSKDKKTSSSGVDLSKIYDQSPTMVKG